MKRNLIAGRFGLADNKPIPTGVDEQASELQLWKANQFDHGIGKALVLLNELTVFPTEVGLDLLVVAAHVHLADTRISRAQQSQDSWTREIRLVVPVSDPERWSTVSSVLVRMLNFLTGDRWALDFRERPDGFGSLVKAAPHSCSRYDALSLFSGGLDSLIGAIDLLEQGRNTLLISHAGDWKTSRTQEEIFQHLAGHSRSSLLDRLRVWMSFTGGIVKGVRAESTTRGRSFLFFAMGVFAGSGLRREFVLSIPENGLIALNVPLDTIRLGANSTRTTHPFYIARWNELIQGLGIEGKVVNPYWAKTKGEMMVECRNKPLLTHLAGRSLSCAHPTASHWRKGAPAAQQCGTCLPCIIRRAAFKRAWNAGNDPTSYTVADLTAQPLRANEARGQQVRSFQVAIERIKRNEDVCRVLIHKPGPLSDDPSQLAELADVYRRGMAEVADLLDGVVTISS